jgi:hypothetical protein
MSTADAIPTVKASRTATARDAAYDLVKGFLVLVMVAFHGIEYFVDVRSHHLDFLAFVTGGFVMVTGFAVSRFYLERCGGANRFAVVERLLWRAARLALLFLVLNLLVHTLVKKNYNGQAMGVGRFLGGLGEVFLSGSRSLSAFEILLPIAYTLAAGGIVLGLTANRLKIAVIGVVLFSGVALFGAKSFNLYYTSIGMIGLALGSIRPEILVGQRRCWPAMVLSLLMVGYFTLVAIVPEDNLLMYAFGVTVVLGSAHQWFDWVGPESRILGALALLGKYSLVCYLEQIFLLQLIKRVGSSSLLGMADAALPFLAVNLVLWFTCRLLEAGRSRMVWLDRSYKWVFG